MTLTLTDTERKALAFAEGWTGTDGWWLAGALANHLWTLTSVTDYYKGNKPQAGAAGRVAKRLTDRKLLERRTWANGTRGEYRITKVGQYALRVAELGDEA